MTVRHATRITLVVFLFVVAQQTLVLDLRIGGIHPDMMVVLPIAAGIAGGPARGATMGFGAGLVADLFLPTPFGLSALVGCMVGFGVGLATLPLDRSTFWLPPLVALVAAAAYEGVYALLGSILGQPQMIHVDIAGIMVLVSVASAAIAVPSVRMVAWAMPAASVEGMPTSAPTLGSRL